MNKKIILLLIVIFFVSCTRISFLHTISDIGENKIFKKEVLGKWSQSGEKDKEIILLDSSQSEGSGLIYRIKILVQKTNLILETQAFLSENYLR